MDRNNIQAQSFNMCVQESLQKHWDLPGMSDYGVQTFQYKDATHYP